MARHIAAHRYIHHAEKHANPNHTIENVDILFTSDFSLPRGLIQRYVVSNLRLEDWVVTTVVVATKARLVY
eukprot:473851-Amorphochlora_amoeboformis.AAC.2